MKLLNIEKGIIKEEEMTAPEKCHGFCFMLTARVQSLSYFSMLFFGLHICFCRISLGTIVPSLKANHEKTEQK